MLLTNMHSIFNALQYAFPLRGRVVHVAKTVSFLFGLFVFHPPSSGPKLSRSVLTAFSLTCGVGQESFS